MHAVRIELGRLISVGTRITYQVTGDYNLLLECLRKYVFKNVLAFRIKNKIAFPPEFW